MKKTIFIAWMIVKVQLMKTQFDLTLGLIPNNNLKDKKDCIDKVKVDNERPVSCSLDGDVLYPVVNEPFNFKEELLNNYRFSYPWTEGDSPGNVPSISYLGNSGNNYSYHNNISVQNGELIVEWKKQTVTTSRKTYSYTGGMLYSLYTTKQGIYYARIKFPDNIYFWPAFWIHSGSINNGDYQEIDFCEMYDECPDEDNQICKERYHELRMNIINNKDICRREARTNLPLDFFTKYHIYKGIWTDYKVEFHYVDQISSSNYNDYFIGIATRYVKPNPFNFYICNNFRPYYPNKKFCSNMANEPACIGNIILGYCTQWNWVFKDIFFPNINYPYKPMNVLITSPPNLLISGCKGKTIHNYLNDKWDSFTDEQKRTRIDFLTIYQPVKCYSDYTALNESQFKSITKGTNFLSGRKLTISNGSGSNLYINESPKASNNWHEFPTHILATEEIAFLNEVAFEEGTFLRAEIIDCSIGTSDVSQRRKGENKDTLPPVLPIDYFDKQDSSYIALQNFYNSPLTSETDNGALQIFPNPAFTHFHISMAEEDYNALNKIELVNTLGQVQELPKKEQYDIQDLPEGVYFIKFYFSSGHIVVKSLVIKR